MKVLKPDLSISDDQKHGKLTIEVHIPIGDIIEWVGALREIWARPLITSDQKLLEAEDEYK